MTSSPKKSTEKLPARFLERMQEIIPSQEWDDFLNKCMDPLPKTIRTTQKFKKSGLWNIHPVPSLPSTYFFQEMFPIGKTISHFCGDCFSSSLSSLLAVEVLNPQPHEKILDMCASPGSKTTAIAERMENTGTLIANEVKPPRLKALHQNIERMGVYNTITTQYDARNLPQFFGEEFNRVLLDAPCSGEGFGRKDPLFYKNTWKEKNIFLCAQLQKQLILSAFEMLELNGEMIYSTCTAAPEENEMVVQHLLDTYPEAEIIPITLSVPHTNGIDTFFDQKICSKEVAQSSCRLYPHQRSSEWDSEFFFLARIRKKELIQRSFDPPPLPNSPYEKLKKNKRAEIITQLFKQYGIPKESFHGSVFLEKNNDIFLSSPDLSWFLRRIKGQQSGLHIFNRETGITSNLAIHFGSHATEKVFHISEKSEADKFLAGYTLFLTENHTFIHGDIIIITFENKALGIGKVIQNTLKNKLDRWRIFQ